MRLCVCVVCFQAHVREAAPAPALPDDGGAQAALLGAVEAAKRRLSTLDETDVPLPCADGDAASCAPQRTLRLTRAAAEAAVEPLLERALAPIDAALREAGMSPDDVDDVVLVGGATRLLAVRARVGGAFEGRALHYDVDPDTAIAVGAARAYNC
jgi:molecular chaperone DnaK (HSP70)